ncbi:MAG: O-antigen ligase family protein [Oscillospiraceae bacterium]|nr:O-antigen ligase family protein [Oscillospiraceae bacterium]
MSKASKAPFPERKKAAMYAKIDTWQGRAARLLVVLLLCIQPLYLHPERYIRLTYHKWTFLVFSVVLALFCVLIIWAFRLVRNPRLLPQDKLHVVDWALLLFAVVTIVSTVLSPFRDEMNIWLGVEEPEGRYDGAITQLLYIAAFFIISRWYRPNVKDFAIFGVSAAIVGLIGIFQFYGMDFFRLWPTDHPRYGGYSSFDFFFRSTLGNVNILATYVCVAILLSGFLFVRLKSKWQPLWLAASALCFWLMDIGGSDSGLVGVVVTMFLAIPFIIESRVSIGRTLVLISTWVVVFALQRVFFEVNIMELRSMESLIPFFAAFIVLLAAGLLLIKIGTERASDAPAKWKLSVIIMVALIIAGLAGVEVMGREEAGRRESFAGRVLFEAREAMHGNLEGEMGSGRVHMWRYALSVVPNHPIIGTGPDTFYHAFPDEAQGFMGAQFDTAHNEYLQILIAQGILGLLAYLVFLGGVFFGAIRFAFRNPMLMAVLAAFVGYSVQAFFNINLPIVSQMLWVLAGMLANEKFRQWAIDS